MVDDLISRQVLRDAMYHEAFEVDSDLQKWDGGCWIRYKMFENVIDDVPSAQKKGHWIIGDVEEYDLSYGDRIYVPNYKCSCCMRTIESYVRWDEPSMPDDADFPEFCPHCGADMRGENDE